MYGTERRLVNFFQKATRDGALTKTFVWTFDFRKGHLVEPGPTCLDDSDSVLVNDVFIGWR